MKQKPSQCQDDELREVYDPSLIRSGVRGKYAKRYHEGTNLILLAPDVATAFPDAKAVNDADIDAFVRRKAESAYHPSCTCRMGTDDMAVVDKDARVHGVEGLRVVDASIMPDVVSGNLNVPTIMMAEKLADAIRGRPAMPAEKVPVWINPNYKTHQR